MAERDEKLSAVGIRSAVGHGQDAGLVVAQLRVELVLERVTRSPDSLSQWIAALYHEAINHAVDHHAVIVGLGHLFVRARIHPLFRPFRQPDKVFNRFRRFLIEKTHREVTFTGDELCIQSGQR